MSGFTSISGIFSGIDTSSLIDSIIEYERQPAALMEVDQTEKTNIITTLKALQAKVYALQAKTQQLTYASTYHKSSINVSDETYLTATEGSGDVTTGTYDIRVLSIARNHQLASQGFQDSDLESFGTGTITLAVGSASPQTITIDETNNSLVGIKNAINDANAGVTATIINDGSSSNSYRLILTAKNTGATNTIKVTSNLAGGTNINLSTASFDVPETISMDSGSSAGISLGSTAAYTGNENKIYTFTVRGDGEQTIGSDNITVDWTDGTNSGSILVTQADFEYELVGDGADGLKMAFSSGTLNSGDTFQVQSFSPNLQQASDAKISFGAADGSGSPIVVTNGTNKFTDVVPGVNLEVKKVTASGDSVSVSTDIDVSAIKQSISNFLSAYNDLQEYIDDQNTYDPESEEGGILLGDSIIQTIQYSIRGSLSAKISNGSDTYNYLSSIGIRTGTDGQLAIKDSSRLEEAIRENLDEVINLFTDTGQSSDGIEFVSAGTSAKEGREFDVRITQAATRGTLTGTGMSDPGTSPFVLDSSNNRLKLTVDGVVSNEIVLTAKSYDSTDELVKELQTRIDGDLKVGTSGVTVSWQDDEDGGGRLILTSSKYGSVSKISVDRSIDNTASTVLGLGASVAVNGQDVQGTINGEEATGSGQYLTGKNTNDTTAGLKIKVTLTEDQLTDGSAAGTITLTKGIASKMNTLLTSLTLSGEGLLDRRIRSYQNQVDNLASQIESFDARLEIRREYLEAKYQAMEAALAELDSVGSYLESQIASLSTNWKGSSKSN